MKKKILGIAVAIVMLFAVAGLAACELDNPTLAEYQATARVDLTNYANSRGQTNFTIENWAVIQGHVTTGKAAIDAAETKPAVRTARDNAKAAVRAVERENNVNNYTRHPNSVDTIDATLENAIRKGFSEEPQIWYIFRYYGTFDGASAVMMGSTENFPGDWELYETVAGITFWYIATPSIIVWYENNFYSLTEAHAQYILTLENLQIIANIHNAI